jgi:hypothetical protein
MRNTAKDPSQGPLNAYNSASTSFITSKLFSITTLGMAFHVARLLFLDSLIF